MEKLNGIVKEYLDNDSDYAILITGDWGTGKTFYYENVLESIIRNTETIKDKRKKYKPIPISLFGLKSIEDIQTQILISLYPILKKRAAKISMSLVKSLAGPLTTLKGIGGGDRLLNAVDDSIKTAISYDNLVLCFDDFERKDEGLNAQQVLGLINSIVEKGGKIIVLANEDKITDKQGYQEFKERVIGHTIEFLPDINNVFDKIVDAKFGGELRYKDFLNSKKEFVLEIFQPNSNNLRTLTFILQKFQKAYSLININIIKSHPLNEHKEHILELLLRFYIAVGIEFKKGTLNYKKDNGITDKENFHLYLFLRNPTKKDKEESSEYIIDFFDKYYRGELEIPFTSKLAFTYITGGDVLDDVKFLAELDRTYNVEKNKINPHNKLLRKLESSKLTLEDDEFDKLVNEILNYVDAGAYKTFQYTYIFRLMCSQENLTKYNAKELKERIIRGIDAGMLNNKYEETDTSSSNFLPENYPFSNEVHEITRKALTVNDQIKQKEQLNLLQQAQDEFYQDVEFFYRTLTTSNNQYIQKPVFSCFDEERLYHWIINSKNNEKNFFKLLLQKRYDSRNGNFLIDYIGEIEVLTDLEGKLKTYIDENNPTSISGYQINEIHKLLEAAIANLNGKKKDIAQLSASNIGDAELKQVFDEEE